MTEPKPTRSQVGVTLAEPERSSLQEIAEKEGISVSAAARRAVKSWLQEHAADRLASRQEAAR